MFKSPLQYEWQYGFLPKVEDVPYDCQIILWSDNYIGIVVPHGNKLNPLRWCDDGYFPKWGNSSPKGWWAIHKEGNKDRPKHIKTWNEMFERPEQLIWKEHLGECQKCKEVDNFNRKVIFSSIGTKEWRSDFCEKGQILMKDLVNGYEASRQ